MARETRGDRYVTDRPTGSAGSAGSPARSATLPATGAQVVVAGASSASLAGQALTSAVSTVQALDADALGMDSVEHLLGEVTVAIRRLQATQSRLAGVWQQRRSPTAATPEQADDAERRSARFLADELRIPPAEAKRTARTGRRLDLSPLLAAAFDEGALSAQHASAVADALRDIPVEHRGEVERDLVALARTATPQQVAKEGRRRLALLDQDRAALRSRARHTRRRAGWWSTDDGGLRVDATLYGLGAEAVRVALDAATPPPRDGDDRSHEQRRADGLVTLAELSLRAGRLPAQHGVRPHVQVVVSLEDLRTWSGVATLGSGESIALDDIAGLLQDCAFSRTILGLAGAPIAGSVASRTVPAALWRALVARDGGCTWANCDAPPSWCQVAHGEVPFAADGVLAPGNAALLCGHHHRRFDRGGWGIRIAGRDVSYVRDEDRPSASELARRHARRPAHAAESHTARHPGPRIEPPSDPPPGPSAGPSGASAGPPSAPSASPPSDPSAGPPPGPPSDPSAGPPPGPPSDPSADRSADPSADPSAGPPSGPLAGPSTVSNRAPAPDPPRGPPALWSASTSEISAPLTGRSGSRSVPS